MAIHKVKNGYLISAHNVWRPGSYDTEHTARVAQRISDDVLVKIQDKVSPKNITIEDLKDK